MTFKLKLLYNLNMDKLKDNLNKIAKLFGQPYNQKFFMYLKEISKPNNRVCNREVQKGEGGWKCLDCELDSLAIFCTTCFNKGRERHKGHKVLFNPTCRGFCDCGDPTVYVREGFCPEHKGPFTSLKEIKDFIITNIDEKLLNDINNILDEIFLLLIEKINVIFNEKIKEELKETIETELFNMIDEIIISKDLEIIEPLKEEEQIELDDDKDVDNIQLGLNIDNDVPQAFVVLNDLEEIIRRQFAVNKIIEFLETKIKEKIYFGFDPVNKKDFVRIYGKKFDKNKKMKVIQYNNYIRILEDTITSELTVKELFNVESMSKEEILPRINEVIKIFKMKRIEENV